MYDVIHCGPWRDNLAPADGPTPRSIQAAKLDSVVYKTIKKEALKLGGGGDGSNLGGVRESMIKNIICLCEILKGLIKYRAKEKTTAQAVSSS